MAQRYTSSRIIRHRAVGPGVSLQAHAGLAVQKGQLHLAEESVPIWRKTEEELGEMNVPPPYWAFAWAGGQALIWVKTYESGSVLRRARRQAGWMFVGSGAENESLP